MTMSRDDSRSPGRDFSWWRWESCPRARQNDTSRPIASSGRSLVTVSPADSVLQNVVSPIFLILHYFIGSRGFLFFKVMDRSKLYWSSFFMTSRTKSYMSLVIIIEIKTLLIITQYEAVVMLPRDSNLNQDPPRSTWEHSLSRYCYFDCFLCVSVLGFVSTRCTPQTLAERLALVVPDVFVHGPSSSPDTAAAIPRYRAFCSYWSFPWAVYDIWFETWSSWFTCRLPEASPNWVASDCINHSTQLSHTHSRPLSIRHQETRIDIRCPFVSDIDMWLLERSESVSAFSSELRTRNSDTSSAKNCTHSLAFVWYCARRTRLKFNLWKNQRLVLWYVESSVQIWSSRQRVLQRSVILNVFRDFGDCHCSCQICLCFAIWESCLSVSLSRKRIQENTLVPEACYEFFWCSG